MKNQNTSNYLAIANQAIEEIDLSKFEELDLELKVKNFYHFVPRKLASKQFDRFDAIIFDVDLVFSKMNHVVLRDFDVSFDSKNVSTLKDEIHRKVDSVIITLAEQLKKDFILLEKLGLYQIPQRKDIDVLKFENTDYTVYIEINTSSKSIKQYRKVDNISNETGEISKDLRSLLKFKLVISTLNNSANAKKFALALVLVPLSMFQIALLATPSIHSYPKFDQVKLKGDFYALKKVQIDSDKDHDRKIKYVISKYLDNAKNDDSLRTIDVDTSHHDIYSDTSSRGDAFPRIISYHDGIVEPVLVDSKSQSFKQFEKSLPDVSNVPNKPLIGLLSLSAIASVAFSAKWLIRFKKEIEEF